METKELLRALNQHVPHYATEYACLWDDLRMRNEDLQLVQYHFKRAHHITDITAIFNQVARDLGAVSIDGTDGGYVLHYPDASCEAFTDQQMLNLAFAHAFGREKERLQGNYSRAAG